jgi:endonuclease/exonuclease/phosphatase family metal-dependent hydrolase
VYAAPSTTDGGTTDAGISFPLEVANWNVEWFGSTLNGPTDETLQLNNVRTVIQEVGADIWGLTELVDVNQFNALKAGLPGYEGFVASDPSVGSGGTHYAPDEQKVGLLYKSGLVSVKHAEVILGANSGDFAGRPPLRVDLRVTRGGTSLDLVAIVLHMKANGTEADYTLRKAAGVALKQYLDTQLPDSRVIVLGDWNDDVDVSITKDSQTLNYLDSPYQNFVDAPAAYAFPTRPLSLGNMGSSVGSTNVIDHQLVSNELAVSHVSNSTRVVHPNIASYGDTTSDHYPVVSRFDLAQVTAPPAPASPVFINEFLPYPNNKPPPDSSQVDFDQAFVEVMNTGSTVVDLSGWKLHDAESYSGAKPARHVFPAGTTLAPGKVYVVYSGASAVPSGATQVAYANGNDGLRFNRGVNLGSSGDTAYLVKPDGTVADSHYYKDTFQGVSYNRSPDATNTGTWTRHDSLSPGLSASPGRRVDGTSF